MNVPSRSRTSQWCLVTLTTLAVACGCQDRRVGHAGVTSGLETSDLVAGLRLVAADIRSDRAQASVGCCDSHAEKELHGAELAAVFPAVEVPSSGNPLFAVGSNGNWLVAFATAEVTRGSYECDYVIFKDSWDLVGRVPVPEAPKGWQRVLRFMTWHPVQGLALCGEDLVPEGGVRDELRVLALSPERLTAHEVYRGQADGFVATSWLDETLVLVLGERRVVLALEPMSGRVSVLYHDPEHGEIVQTVPSPDGRYLAMSRWDIIARAMDVWLLDLQSGESERLTTERGSHNHSVFCWRAGNVIRFVRQSHLGTDGREELYEATLDLRP